MDFENVSSDELDKIENLLKVNIFISLDVIKNLIVKRLLAYVKANLILIKIWIYY